MILIHVQVLILACVVISPAFPLEEQDSQIPGHFLNSFLIETDSLGTAETVAKEHGFMFIEKLPQLDIYLLEHPEVTGRSKRSADDLVSRLREDSRVTFAEQQITLKRVKRNHQVVHDKQLEFPIREITDNSKFYRVSDKFDTRDGLGPRFNDRYYSDQWYLVNDGQTGGDPGVDLNVLPAWEKGFNGRNVVVTILDDGIDHEHPDITNNYDPEASADMNDKRDAENDPTPDKSKRGNSHGTRCAGEIAAEANNKICGVGVAHRASIGGIRILDGPITDELEARALLYRNDHIQIYSSSWGPHDDGTAMEAPKRACADALRKGVETGRGGKGSIYVWATGNGGLYGDMCGADGYVSSPESISVQSLTDKGDMPFFGEKCSSTMIAVPTGGEATQSEELKAEYKIKVVTTDIDGGCVENFEGTSSAAPLASGCYALVLQANSELTWRDVQHITIHAARIPFVDESWIVNGAGFHVNSKFGFGIMDCSAMVNLAQGWESVPEQHICEAEPQVVDRKITTQSCARVFFTFDGCKEDSKRRINSLEHVQLHMNARSRRRGNVEITLQSPANTRSELLTHRPPDDTDEDIDFTFMTVHSWGENPEGQWLVEVCDNPGETNYTNNVIHLHSFTLRTFGFHDTSERQTKKSSKPTSLQLQELKQREFTNSRQVNLKRAQTFESRKETENVYDFAKSADDVLSKIAHLFDSRELKHNFNNYKTSDQFGKRGNIGNLKTKSSDSSDMRREILELLAEIEVEKQGQKNYIERYLQYKREQEKKSEIHQLIRDLDEILNDERSS